MRKFIPFIILISFFSYGNNDNIKSQKPDEGHQSSNSHQVIAEDLLQNDYFQMSIEDLLKIKIVSASRNEENAFKAPLSSWVILRNEIISMGATSIPDVLRICPGLIVREISNGTYDVSIRGGIDGCPQYAYSYLNTSILVMIDNRPVFSYLQGGTYWQNLPVGMAEIDRIEVVYGPISPLYGPNAVSGVINIITNRSSIDGTFGSGMLMYGPKSKIMSSQIGTKFSETMAIDFSLNYENRDRFSTEFYNTKSQKYVPIDSININRNEYESRFPSVNQSLHKVGATLNFNYTKSPDLTLNLSGSLNHNIGLMPLASNAPISNFINNSENIYLKSKIYGFSIQASYLNGHQGITGNLLKNSYNYNTTDLYLDYEFKLLNHRLLIKPAVSFQSAYVNDLNYAKNDNKVALFNNEARLNDVAGSLKIEVYPIEKVRLILAGRYDKFTYPQKGVFSYQGILNYSFSENNVFRFVSGHSFNSSFFASTLMNQTNENPGFNLHLQGNQNLKLMNNTMFEIGNRLKINDNLLVDIALFKQEFKDLPILIYTKNSIDNNTPTIHFETENIPLVIKQNGATISLQSSFAKGKIQFRPHLTLQETKLVNFSPYYNNSGVYASGVSKDSTFNKKSPSTPTLWAGFNLILIPTQKLSFNVSGYYFSKYQLHLSSEVNTFTGAVTDQQGSFIASKFLLNLNIRYEIVTKINAFINIRNILNQKTAEGFGSDRLGTNFLLGLSFNY